MDVEVIVLVSEDNNEVSGLLGPAEVTPTIWDNPDDDASWDNA
jgi:hypothetical protein